MDPQPIMQTRFIIFVGRAARVDELRSAQIQVAALSVQAPTAQHADVRCEPKKQTRRCPRAAKLERSNHRCCANH